MNSYRNTNEVSAAPGSLPSPPAFSAPRPYEDSHNPSLPESLQSPPVLQMGPTPPTLVLPSFPTSSVHSGDQTDPGFSRRLSSQASVSSQQAPTPSQMPNPYRALTTPPSFQLSFIVPSPDLQPAPTPPSSQESCPNLECCICFCQFNNVFRCPKMLQCKHTFCLECLARINVKSSEPSAIQCPLCRGLTPLPALGLPKLDTDSAVVSYLPAAMQRIYSIRFLRNKGKLQVKRSSEGHQWWGHRPRRSTSHSVDVGLPSPTVLNQGGAVGGALLRLSSRPACRDFLLASVVVMMIVLLMVIIVIFVLAFR